MYHPIHIRTGAIEGSEDDPVSQRSQGSLDEHEGDLQLVRNLFGAQAADYGKRNCHLIHIVGINNSNCGYQ